MKKCKTVGAAVVVEFLGVALLFAGSFETLGYHTDEKSYSVLTGQE
jgi:hypothetical protein